MTINDIPENIKYSFTNEKFLKFDSGFSDEEIFLIFTTDTNLLHLKNSQNWYLNRTFWSYQRFFFQLYVNR